MTGSTTQTMPSSTGTRLSIFVCSIFLLIGSPCKASAEEILRQGIKKYDYDAVCDFIFARQYDALHLIIEGSKKYKKTIKNFSNGDGRFDLNRYADENISIYYFVLGGGALPRIVSISIKPPVAKYTKPNIAIRFGIVGSIEQDLVLGCDASELKMNFDNVDIREVNIANQY